MFEVNLSKSAPMEGGGSFHGSRWSFPLLPVGVEAPNYSRLDGIRAARRPAAALVDGYVCFCILWAEAEYRTGSGPGGNKPGREKWKTVGVNLLPWQYVFHRIFLGSMTCTEFPWKEI